jgi:hypothetical protein
MLTAFLIGIGALLVLILAVSPLVLPALYRRLVFYPEKASGYRPCTLQGIAAQDVVFTSGGLKLHGWFFAVPGATKTILFSHSNAGNIESWSGLIRALVATGYSVFAYDWRGYGKSEGKPTVPGVCRDGLSAFDYLVRERKIPGSQIAVYGCSLGTGVSTYIASKRQCAGIILQAGFSSLRQTSIDLIPAVRFVPGFLYFRPGMDNADILSRSRVPLLLLHGEFDSMIPLSHAQLNLERSAASKKRLLVFKGSDHIDGNTSGEVTEAVRTFIDDIDS